MMKMKMKVGTPTILGKEKMIPIWNDEPDGYTLWVIYDEQAPEQSLEYAEMVARLLNSAAIARAEKED